MPFNSDQLYICTPIFNPRRYKRRYELYRRFEEMVHKAGAQLYTVELALGERDFEVTDPHNIYHLQLRSRDEWFVKENLINLGFRMIPKEAKYMAWIDSDVQFTDPNWATETLHMLQHHPVVQMFSQVANMDPSNRIFQVWNGFGYSYKEKRTYQVVGKDYNYWHPGFAWAYTREALNAFGGLMDRLILGSGDSHMASAFIGRAGDTVHGLATDAVKNYIFNWENNAQKYLRDNGYCVGYVQGLINHYWHGQMKNRRYKERWDILIEHQFDPYADLVPDLDGLLHLVDHKYGLREECQDYFSGRNEDSIDFDPNESTIMFR